jgi:rubrerythrin
VTAQSTHLVGASVWQQELFDHLAVHVEAEKGIIEGYRRFAEEAPSDAVRYLVRLILDDEARHHRILAELANTLRAQATFQMTDAEVPHLRHPHDVKTLLEETRRFLDVEQKDRAELKALSKLMRPVADTTMWAFLIDLMRSDTERHIRILRYIARVAAHVR